MSSNRRRGSGNIPWSRFSENSKEKENNLVSSNLKRDRNISGKERNNFKSKTEIIKTFQEPNNKPTSAEQSSSSNPNISDQHSKKLVKSGKHEPNLEKRKPEQQVLDDLDEFLNWSDKGIKTECSETSSSELSDSISTHSILSKNNSLTDENLVQCCNVDKTDNSLSPVYDSNQKNEPSKEQLQKVNLNEVKNSNTIESDIGIVSNLNVHAKEFVPSLAKNSMSITRDKNQLECQNDETNVTSVHFEIPENIESADEDKHGCQKVKINTTSVPLKMTETVQSDIDKFRCRNDETNARSVPLQILQNIPGPVRLLQKSENTSKSVTSNKSENISTANKGFLQKNEKLPYVVHQSRTTFKSTTSNKSENVIHSTNKNHQQKNEYLPHSNDESETICKSTTLNKSENVIHSTNKNHQQKNGDLAAVAHVSQNTCSSPATLNQSENVIHCTNNHQQKNSRDLPPPAYSISPVRGRGRGSRRDQGVRDKLVGEKKSSNNVPNFSTEVTTDCSNSNRTINQEKNTNSRDIFIDRNVGSMKEKKCSNNVPSLSTEVAGDFSNSKKTDTYDKQQNTHSIKRQVTSGNTFTRNEGITLLVLGQSGVGKSTWINSFVNYIRFEDLENAEKQEIIHVVPTKFTVCDDNYETKVVYMGYDANESEEIGESSTKECRMYKIVQGKRIINIIDTPGMGDTKGLTQDRINIDKILNFLQSLDSIHGICILLKPNESRINTLFKFCIKEIVFQLHNNASKNIIFCFTNSRSTLYKPGDTLTTLHQLMKEMQFEFEMDKRKIYCLDNEAYRYLCTFKIQNYTNKEKECFQKSYSQSVKESKRLLEYVSEIHPHRVNETTVLNHVRRVVMTLAQPLADVLKAIDMNIEQCNRKNRQLKNLQQNIRPAFTVNVSHDVHDKPRLLCHSKRCCTHCRLENSGAEYKKPGVCYSKCNIVKFGVKLGKGNPLLQKISYMNNGKCKKCECSWMDHSLDVMSVKHVEVPAQVTNNKPNPTSRTDEEKTKFIKTKQNVIDRCAKFGLFLKKVSLIQSGDIIREYLSELVKAETSKFNPLQTTLKMYDEHVKSLSDTTNDSFFTVENALKWQQELYGMESFGENLKQTIDKTLLVENRLMQEFLEAVVIEI